ncbi:MAG TPA: tryptophan synthase subunit alpha [Tepidisphaeraceae bacterium]|jgi:tryptophan synthase alpha chain
MTATVPSFAESIAAARGERGIALMPFIAAGYPDLATSLAILPALAGAGAAAIEVGFPFSDPVADGPVIQAAFTEALLKGLKVDQIFDGVAAIKDRIAVPMAAMVSYSIVYRYGVERFAKRAKEAGFSGLIVPDLPPPEAQNVCGLIQAAGLATILLISPSTPPGRRAEIARLCSGFIYYLSISGITGERDQLPAGVEDNVRQIKSLTGVPVCVGFGVSKPQHVRQLTGVADGAIVGSAVVRRIQQHAGEPTDAVVAAVVAYVQELGKDAR